MKSKVLYDCVFIVIFLIFLFMFDITVAPSWIGADSGNNHLPEPSASEVYRLLDLLKQFTFIAPKKNLNRLLNKEKN